MMVLIVGGIAAIILLWFMLRPRTPWLNEETTPSAQTVSASSRSPLETAQDLEQLMSLQRQAANPEDPRRVIYLRLQHHQLRDIIHLVLPFDMSSVLEPIIGHVRMGRWILEEAGTIAPDDPNHERVVQSVHSLRKFLQSRSTPPHIKWLCPHIPALSLGLDLLTGAEVSEQKMALVVRDMPEEARATVAASPEEAAALHAALSSGGTSPTK